MARNGEAEPQELNRLEVLRALRIADAEAITSTAHLTLSGGAFLTGFALWLGAGNFYMGLLGAVPTLAGLIQVVASYFVERRGERKRFSAFLSGAGRLLWIPILLIPFAIPGQSGLVALLFLVLLSFLFINAAAPAFTSWLADLVPPDHRGRFFGRRNMLAGLSTMVVSLPAAWFLDLATKRNLLPDSVGFAVVFGLAAAFGAASFALVLRQPEPPMRRAEEAFPSGFRGLTEFYATPLKDPGFRRFMLYLFVFASGQFFAAPFYTVYAMQELGLGYVWLQVMATASGASSMLSMPLWGYLTDKFGPRPLLAIGIFGVGLLPLTWMLTTPTNIPLSLVIVILNNLAGGFFWAGVGLTQFNILIGISPAERKSVYIGMASAMTAIAGGIAPVLGGALLTTLQAKYPDTSILPYQILFAVNAVLRFAALAFQRRIPAPGTASPREVLAQIGTSQVGAWKHIRRLHRPASEAGRRESAHALGTAKASLAVEELVAALDDPSLHVREEAALALGEIGDARAVDALVEALDDPASGIADEAIESLGRIGDESAVPALTNLVRDGEAVECVLAARALGRIGSPAAVEALIAAFESDALPHVLEAAAAGLGDAGDSSAVGALTARLPESPRTLRIAIVRALGKLADGECAPPLIDLIHEETDPSLITHAAVALAMLEAPHAVEPLLSAFDRVDSRVARRQILHAVGTLIGVGEEYYALLAADAFMRDESVARAIRELGGSGSKDFAGRRRALEGDHALAHYAAGEYNAALHSLSRLRTDSDSHSAGIVLEWLERSARDRDVDQEEFLLGLTAARANT